MFGTVNNAKVLLMSLPDKKKLVPPGKQVAVNFHQLYSQNQQSSCLQLWCFPMFSRQMFDFRPRGSKVPKVPPVLVAIFRVSPMIRIRGSKIPRDPKIPRVPGKSHLTWFGFLIKKPSLKLTANAPENRPPETQ